MTTVNRQITLARRPKGQLAESCFSRSDDNPAPTPGAGEALGKVEWLSIDPTIRMWMAMDTYLPAIEIGAPIRSAGLVRVVESDNPGLPVGTLVFATPGWQEYAIVTERDQADDNSGSESGQDAVYCHADIEPLGDALAALWRKGDEA